VTLPRLLPNEKKSSADGIKFGYLNIIIVVEVVFGNFIFIHEGTSS
jgi:hypothetical protein